MLARRAGLAWRRHGNSATHLARSAAASDNDTSVSPATTAASPLHAGTNALQRSRLHVLVNAPRASRRPLGVATATIRNSCALQHVRTQFSAANDRDDDDGYDAREHSHHDLVGEYLETLRRANQSENGWRAALEIFDAIRAANGLGLTVDVATSLIEVLGARKRFAECIDVLRYSREQGVRPRIHAYSSAIACCYHEHKFVQALKVFEVMRNDGYVPKSVTYSRALSAALKSDQHELVLEIFDDMLRHKVDATIVIYNNILNSCARVGDGHSAVGVLRAIRQRSLEMTQSTYHSLAICAGKTGLADLALDVLASLEHDGFTPTMTIYNSAISACAKAKRWSSALGVYRAMTPAMQAQLRDQYLSAVLMAHAKSPNNDDKRAGLALFRARKDSGDDLNMFAYNAALTALLESGELAQVHAFAKDMKRDGLQWDTLTYQCIVLAHIRSGDVSAAVRMLHSHAKKMDKSTECYRELIQHYANERKNPREACRITMQMMQNNARLSRLDWHNALEHALMLPDRALYWNFRKWMKIRAAGIIDDVPDHLMLPDNVQKQKKVHQHVVAKHQQRQAERKAAVAAAAAAEDK